LAQRDAIEAACARLRGVAEVEELEFDYALSRARDLLRLRPRVPVRECAQMQCDHWAVGY
jgi:hypothetical protein